MMATGPLRTASREAGVINFSIMLEIYRICVISQHYKYITKLY